MRKASVKVVNVHQAKTHLSRLLAEVAEGQEIVIAKSGRPVARLIPVEAKAPRRLGMDAGLVTIAEDFDAPLPDSVLEDFER
jgi:prevent-host-death family protein